MPSPAPSLARQLVPAFLLLGLSLLGSPRAQAQTPNNNSSQLYNGPRFPGGPDSLRSLVNRVQQQTSLNLAGKLFLRLELAKDGKPSKAQYLQPATRPASALARSKEAQALSTQLTSALPAFQVNGVPTDPVNSEPISFIIPPQFWADVWARAIAVQR